MNYSLLNIKWEYVSFHTVTLFHSREKEMVVDTQGKNITWMYLCMWPKWLRKTVYQICTKKLYFHNDVIRVSAPTFYILI